MTTRQYGRHLADWLACIGLDPHVYGTHSLRRTKATLIYRRNRKPAGRSVASRPYARSRAQYGISWH